MRTEEQLLASFCSTDPVREKIFAPFQSGWYGKKWVCASDGYAMLIVPETPQNKIEKPVPYPPNLETIMPELNTETPLNVESLLRNYLEIPLIKEWVHVECPSCNGEKHFRHYNLEYSCMYCEKSGVIRTNETVLVKDGNYIFTIEGVPFKASLFPPVISVFEQDANLSARIRHLKQGHPCVIECSNGYVIVIMPIKDIGDNPDGGDWKIVPIQ